MAINLLPKDLLPTAGFLKTAALLRSVITAGFALFVVAAIGLIGFFVFNSVSLRSSNTKQEELKNSIKSLEQTEQGLVLVKDRLVKVGQIEAKESAGARERERAINSVSTATAVKPAIWATLT